MPLDKFDLSSYTPIRNSIERTKRPPLRSRVPQSSAKYSIKFYK
nr:MAG TPA: hypothetical protein [Caudoviricetes sp.]